MSHTVVAVVVVSIFVDSTRHPPLHPTHAQFANYHPLVNDAMSLCRLDARTVLLLLLAIYAMLNEQLRSLTFHNQFLAVLRPELRKLCIPVGKLPNLFFFFFCRSCSRVRCSFTKGATKTVPFLSRILDTFCAKTLLLAGNFSEENCTGKNQQKIHFVWMLEHFEIGKKRIMCISLQW